MLKALQSALINLDYLFSAYVVAPIETVLFFDLAFWDNGAPNEIALPAVVVWLVAALLAVVLLVVDSRRQVQVPAASIKSLPMCVRSLMVMDLAVKGLVASRSRYQQLTNPRLRPTRKPLRLRWHSPNTSIQ